MKKIYLYILLTIITIGSLWAHFREPTIERKILWFFEEDKLIITEVKYKSEGIIWEESPYNERTTTIHEFLAIPLTSYFYTEVLVKPEKWEREE